MTAGRNGRLDLGRAASPAGTNDLRTVTDVRRRAIRIHVPPVMPIGSPPLLVVLHHGGGNADAIERLTDVVPAATSRGFVVMVPEAVQARAYWNDGRFQDVDDLAFLTDAIAAVRDQLSLDLPAVYLLGFSNGASMALLAAVRLREKIAGVGGVAGTLGRRVASSGRPATPIPLVYFHGTQDPFAYYHVGGSRGTWRGASLSVSELRRVWSGWNGCGDPAVEWFPERADDGTQVVRTSHRSCRGGADVIVYSILGGGHTWPGGPDWTRGRAAGRISRQIDATSVSCDFFLDHFHGGAQQPRR